MRGVWVISVRSREPKSTMLNKHLRIADRGVFLYEEIPYEINRHGKVSLPRLSVMGA